MIVARLLEVISLRAAGVSFDLLLVHDLLALRESANYEFEVLDGCGYLLSHVLCSLPHLAVLILYKKQNIFQQLLGLAQVILKVRVDGQYFGDGVESSEPCLIAFVFEPEAEQVLQDVLSSLELVLNVADIAFNYVHGSLLNFLVIGSQKLNDFREDVCEYWVQVILISRN